MNPGLDLVFAGGNLRVHRRPGPGRPEADLRQHFPRLSRTSGHQQPETPPLRDQAGVTVINIFPRVIDATAK